MGTWLALWTLCCDRDIVSKFGHGCYGHCVVIGTWCRKGDMGGVMDVVL